MLKDTTCCYVCTHIQVSHASMLHGLTSDAMAYDTVGTFRPSLDACVAAGCLWSDPAGCTLTKCCHFTQTIIVSMPAEYIQVKSRIWYVLLPETQVL